MAKQGVTYYQIDTDRYQDKRIKKLKKAYGCVGLAVYDYMLCECYRVLGWGMEWDDDACFDVADYLGIKENMVGEVVRYCAFVGLFDKALLGCGIVTSKAIQRRYLDMCKRSKRISAYIPEEHRLYYEELAETTEETTKTPEELENLQRNCENYGVLDTKEKKRKEKIIKERVCDAHTPTHAQEIEETLFSKYCRWCAVYAPLALQYKEPLNEAQFDQLNSKYGAAKMKQCAIDMHNKEACVTNRNAYYTNIRYLDKL